MQSNNRTTKRLWSLEDRTQCLSQRKVLYLRMHTCMFQAVFALHGHTCCAWTLWFDSFTTCDVCGRICRKGSPTLTLWGVKHGALRAKATMFSFDICQKLYLAILFAEMLTPPLFSVSFLRHISGALSRDKNGAHKLKIVEH